MAYKKEIAKKTEDLLKEYNIDTMNGVDIIGLAKQMGFVVGNAGLDDNDDGFIMVNRDADKILGIETTKLIGVNANRDYVDKRFIIAHELGHYVLHCRNDKIYAHRESAHGRSDEENDVDFFAACLLMPADAFSAAFEKIKANSFTEKIKELQKIFDVPFESVARRIDELGLSIAK
ncbi:MAG: ImmA/IrrE family metallo-endopeptidase [Clostridia bacterium]|nr:ImmA/IrrE family metallo-endopeptidase [Clostridia bacterium]MBR6524129.1 ImmA/IrrE family metallo-endopeptidase [Clostridia bacterium]